MTTVAITPAPSVAPVAVNKWLVTVSIAFGSLMATIDSSIVNVALPVLRGTLGATLEEITWVSTAYIIATVMVMPLTGFLGAFFGQKRVYLLSLVVFVVGSALCGLARSLPVLVCFRVIQGLGAGALQPTQQAILRQTFPPHEQGMAMAMWAMAVMIGPAVGPSLGGVIIDSYSWPWIFYINLPVGALGAFMTWRFVHEPDDVRQANRARAEQQRRSLDVAGIVLMCVGVASLQYLLEEGPRADWFESTRIVVAAFIAMVALVSFIAQELVAEAPVVNLRLFRDPTFASGTALGAVLYAVLMGSMFLLPVFMQELLHYDATHSGVMLMPRTIAMMIATPIVGRLYARVPPALTMAVGVGLFVVASFQLSHITLQSSQGDIVVPLLVTGVAFACLFIPLTTAALTNVPRPLLADAAGLSSFVRQLGGTVGLTVFATSLSRFATQATGALRTSVSGLRPEVSLELAGLRGGAVARGLGADAADAAALKIAAGRATVQGLVLAFEKSFLLQGMAFVAVLPLLFFLRVDTKKKSSVPTEAPME